MIDRLIDALAASKNEAADDVLLDALRLGSEQEQVRIMEGLLRRKTVRGLSGVIGQFSGLPESLQLQVLADIRSFYGALRECGRSDDRELRLMALKLIALGRQGKLAYVLSENLHDPDETLSKAAVEAMVGLARWVSTETRRLQRGELPAEESATVHAALMEQRPEVEAAVARAFDLHRGKHGQDLLRATLLLADSPASKTLAILHTTKHGGQSPMVRRLQQPPASEHTEAFLLGAANGQLRAHFGSVFSHIEEAPVLDALLRKTHWLKDQQLQTCMHLVNRGAWWGDAELARDAERRDSGDAARIAEWLAVSGMHDVVQDERMEKLRQRANTSSPEDFAARLRLLRVAMRRRRGASVQLLRSFLADPDERLARLAAREIVRRRPADFENILLQVMTSAPESVRKVVGPAIAQAGFEQFWTRFDRLDKSTRRQAGRAMLKLLPDGVQVLSRRLAAGPVEQRIKAMQITQELGLCEQLMGSLTQICSDPNPRLRSKAVSVIGQVPLAAPDLLLDKVLQDPDARVRANAIEVLEGKKNGQYLPLLAQRARALNSRERANAIKAMHRMRVGAATDQLTNMMRDARPEHRVSAMWAMKEIGWWKLLNEVANLARQDGNLKVRRYAMTILRSVAEMVAEERKAKAG